MEQNNYSNFLTIGGGSFGTAIASYISRITGKSLIYTQDINVVSEINQLHLNSKYLGNINLHKRLRATNNLSDALTKTDVIVIAVPSYSFSEILEQLKDFNIPAHQTILIATKGLANNPVELFSDRIKKVLPNQFGFLSGPNFAKEIAQNRFTAITISSKNLSFAQKIAKLLKSDTCEITVSQDIITIQIASIVKNIAAIKSGMMNASLEGENAKAWLITKAVQEIKIISTALGSDASAILEPAVIGDLVLTCYSTTSRNTKFGYDFHQNGYSKDFVNNYPFLVEGIEGAKLINKLISKFNLELPIINSVITKLIH